MSCSGYRLSVVHRFGHIVLGSVKRAVAVELLSEFLGLVDILYAVVLLVALVAFTVLQMLAVLEEQLLGMG